MIGQSQHSSVLDKLQSKDAQLGILSMSLLVGQAQDGHTQHISLLLKLELCIADLSRHSAVSDSAVLSDGTRAAISCKCSSNMDRTHKAAYLHSSRVACVPENRP